MLKIKNNCKSQKNYWNNILQKLVSYQCLTSRQHAKLVSIQSKSFVLGEYFPRCAVTFNFFYDLGSRKLPHLVSIKWFFWGKFMSDNSAQTRAKRQQQFFSDKMYNLGLCILSIPGGSGDKKPFIETILPNLKAFFALWPLHQWVSSLLILIILYWATGYWYNKYLHKIGGWLTMKTRCWLIIIDLSINLSLGLYYMYHRETMFGQIMMQCPIAISPIIFALELLCVFFYYRRFGTISSSNDGKSADEPSKRLDK